MSDPNVKPKVKASDLNWPAPTYADGTPAPTESFLDRQAQEFNKKNLTELTQQVLCRSENSRFQVLPGDRLAGESKETI